MILRLYPWGQRINEVRCCVMSFIGLGRKYAWAVFLNGNNDINNYDGDNNDDDDGDHHHHYKNDVFLLDICHSDTGFDYRCGYSVQRWFRLRK